MTDDTRKRAEGLAQDFPHGPLPEQWEFILRSERARGAELAAAELSRQYHAQGERLDIRTTRAVLEGLARSIREGR